MALFAVTTFGPDRPKTLAMVAGAVAQVGGNLEDVSATILRGHGALMLIVRLPEGTGQAALEGEVRSALDGTGVSVHVERCMNEIQGPAPTPSHVLSVYGADRPGIVHQVADLLGRHGANITDLDSRLVGRADRPVYAMLIELVMPDGARVEALKADLAALGKTLGVDVSLRTAD